MKAFFLGICLLIASLVTAQTTNTPVKWLTHTDSSYFLTIQYPSDWQLKPPTKSVRFFITSYPESDTDNFRDNLNCITPQPVEKGMTIKMAEADIAKSLSESLEDFKVIRSGYSQWNNTTSYELEYSCSYQGSENTTYSLHMLQKMAIINGKLYALTFSAEDDFYKKNISTIRRMIESFKVDTAGKL